MVREYHQREWWIVFGSGEFAHFQDFKEYVDTDGDDMWAFYIDPNDVINDKYQLKRGQEIDIDTGLIEAHYTDNWVVPLIVSSNWTVFFIECDLMGHETKATRRLAHKDAQINLLRKQYRSANAANYTWAHEYELQGSRMLEKAVMDRRLRDILKETRREKEDTSNTDTQ